MTNRLTTITAAFLAVVAGLSAGCASVAVTDEALQQRTATALSLTPSSFEISNRVNDGLKTTYKVSTSSGRQYSCYVTGGVSVTGRVVSDAICSDAPGTVVTGAAPAAAAPPAASCNALLKAAGKCK